MVQEVSLFVVAVVAVKRITEVPIGCVDDFHAFATLRRAASRPVFSGANLQHLRTTAKLTCRLSVVFRVFIYNVTALVVLSKKEAKLIFPFLILRKNEESTGNTITEVFAKVSIFFDILLIITCVSPVRSCSLLRLCPCLRDGA